mmetsp:Transcript_280/g.263  ORF Transcript_280/g.263 Transcript_280/m.263 type:complete len:101 (+) Transcript_280:235-537(+)
MDALYEIGEKDREFVENIKDDTTNKADYLRRKEEEKIKEIANLLVDMQINKLETKIAYLEEYERILWQERKQQEVFQKMMIAERVAIAHKRLELHRQTQP